MEVKTLWLVRGVSGSGKSTVAKELTKHLPFATGTEADNFRYIDGVYAWDKVSNYYAHQKCQQEVQGALEFGFENVVVSNTSTKARDVRKYKELAEGYGYRFISIIVENYHETGNVHDVSEDTLCKMEHALKSNMKLK